MGCSSCKKKKRFNLSKFSEINKKKLRFDKVTGKKIEREVVFSGWAGKLVYFAILLIIALTPLVNLVVIYFFWLAVYGGDKNPVEVDASQMDLETQKV